MDKTEYILRSMQKISHKKWELFVISRIIHQLDDLEVEFVTQQLVRRPNGEHALMDLYLPQFNLHLEINEKQHAGEKHQESDFKRNQDIVAITSREPYVIPIYREDLTEKSLNEIRTEVDSFISLIKAEKNNQIQNNTFTPWDFESRYNPEKYIKLGQISTSDNVVFRYQIDALRLFGFKGAGYQKAAWLIKDGSNDMVWFPRLYEHGIWLNELSHDGQRIYERAANYEARESLKKQLVDEGIKYKGAKKIIFAKAKDPLGADMLRYVGSFKMNMDDFSEDYIRFDLISSSEKIRL